MARSLRLYRFSLVVGASLLLLVGCSDDSTSKTFDGALSDAGAERDVAVDAPATDSAPEEDSAADTAPADLEPDRPQLPPHWERVGGVSPALEDHTATLLQNGDVLIVGGYQQGSTVEYQDAAWRYIPDQDTFVSAGTMTMPRAVHTATLLADGRVLVVGGENETAYLQTTELYDPSQPVGSAWSTGPELFAPRHYQAAVRLQNGEVLIAGGFSNTDALDSMLIFDPLLDSWTVPAATLKEARAGQSMTLLQNGKVLIAGGITSASKVDIEYIDSLEVYDPSAGTTTLLSAAMSKKRIAHTATLLEDGRVLIVGGFCGANCAGGQDLNDIYDPVSDTVIPISHPGDLPSSHVGARLNDGRVLIAGSSWSGNEAKAAVFSTASGGFWKAMPDMLEGRWGATGTLLDDGSVLVACGVASASPYIYARTERFFP